MSMKNMYPQISVVQRAASKGPQKPPHLIIPSNQMALTAHHTSNQ